MHSHTRALVLWPALAGVGCAGCFGLPGDPFEAKSTAGGAQESAPPAKKKNCTATYFSQLAEDQCDAPGQDGRPPELHGGMSTGEGFKARLEEVRTQVPTWKRGSGVALHMVTPKTHQHFSVSYTDPNGPTQQDANGVKLTVVEAFAKDEGKPIGHFVLVTPKLSPGKFKLAPDNVRMILISVFGDDLDINSENAAASTNKGSAMDLVLRQADNGSDLEGLFAGRLVSKDGSSVHTIEAGYIYIKQPDGAGDSR
jgi:hypothetical protein